MEHDITLTVNGTDEDLTVESRTLLVHALRDRLGYTGPNVGCESGKCGACTVQVDGDAVKSCTILAVQTDGSEVTTAAGFADGDDLAPLQEAFHDEHGLQCGYCTPGLLATADEFLDAEPDPSREAIRGALKGNVCRCTGYQNIVDAVETAAARRAAADEGMKGTVDEGSVDDEPADGGPTDDGPIDDELADGGRPAGSEDED